MKTSEQVAVFCLAVILAIASLCLYSAKQDLEILQSRLVIIDHQLFALETSVSSDRLAKCIKESEVGMLTNGVTVFNRWGQPRTVHQTETKYGKMFYFTIDDPSEAQEWGYILQCPGCMGFVNSLSDVSAYMRKNNYTYKLCN